MVRYVTLRLIQSLLVLGAVLSLVFFGGRVVGNPAALILGPEARVEDVATLEEQLGYNQPILTQYADFARGWVAGDFKDSWWQKRPAFDLVTKRIMPTLALAAASMAMAIPIGIGLGALGARRPGSWSDRLTTGVALFGVSTIEFWMALVLIWVVAIQWGLVPVSGANTPTAVILPAITLAFRPLGRIAQVTRSTLADVLSKPYIKSARGKGLSESRILVVYGFKNAAIPVFTLIGDELIAFINGAVVVETIFGWPGMGSLVVSAVLNRDLPLIEATVFVIAILVIATNLVVDITYTILDPKISFRRTRTE